MAKRVIQPARFLTGGLSVPGDKSISHRFAILAALAEGTSEIRNYSPAADCASTLACLERLGVQTDSVAEGEPSSRVLRIHGAGLHGWKQPRGTLEAGNSGTTIRLLSGALAGQRFASSITGDDSLRRRPMHRVIKPLREMGAHIAAHNEGYAPLEFTGAALHPIEYSPPMASAQVKSAVLLAGLFATGATAVIEPVRTRDHSEIALTEFGVSLRRNGTRIEVTGQARLQPRSLIVPGDLSSAVFFIAAASILPGSKLLIAGVGLNPTRSAILDTLAQMGASIRVTHVEERNGELVGELEVAAPQTPLRGGKIGGNEVARLIDELPMLAALAPYTQDGIEIREAQELRVKESDRITVLAENLRRLGARVKEYPDGMRIGGRNESGGAGLKGAEVDPQGDHRLAMALAIAALGAEGETTLCGSECVGVSYPQFFEDLESVLKR